jgi:hypothetical protein
VHRIFNTVNNAIPDIPDLAADIQTIEKVQEKAVGMISGLKGKTYAEKCEELNLESLEDRRKINDMAQVYRLVHGIDKIDRVQIFKHVQAGRTRLSADPLNIRPDTARLEVRRNFFSQRVTADWNRIGAEIKKQCKRARFQVKLQEITQSNRNRWRAMRRVNRRAV